MGVSRRHPRAQQAVADIATLAATPATEENWEELYDGLHKIWKQSSGFTDAHIDNPSQGTWLKQVAAFKVRSAPTAAQKSCLKGLKDAWDLEVEQALDLFTPLVVFSERTLKAIGALARTEAKKRKEGDGIPIEVVRKALENIMKDRTSTTTSAFIRTARPRDIASLVEVLRPEPENEEEGTYGDEQDSGTSTECDDEEAAIAVPDALGGGIAGPDSVRQHVRKPDSQADSGHSHPPDQHRESDADGEEDFDSISGSEEGLDASSENMFDDGNEVEDEDEDELEQGRKAPSMDQRSSPAHEPSIFALPADADGNDSKITGVVTLCRESFSPIPEGCDKTEDLEQELQAHLLEQEDSTMARPATSNARPPSSPAELREVYINEMAAGATRTSQPRPTVNPSKFSSQAQTQFLPTPAPTGSASTSPFITAPTPALLPANVTTRNKRPLPLSLAASPTARPPDVASMSLQSSSPPQTDSALSDTDSLHPNKRRRTQLFDPLPPIKPNEATADAILIEDDDEYAGQRTETHLVRHTRQIAQDLRPRTWLHSCSITSIIDLLVMACGSEFQTYEESLPMPSKADDSWHWEPPRKYKLRAQTENLLFILNWGDVHWSVALMMVGLKKWVTYDSKPGYIHNLDVITERVAIKLVTNIAGEHAWEKSGWTLQMVKTPAQVNAHDCGILAAVFALRALLLPLPHDTTSDSNTSTHIEGLYAKSWRLILSSLFFGRRLELHEMLLKPCQIPKPRRVFGHTKDIDRALDTALWTLQAARDAKFEVQKVLATLREAHAIFRKVVEGGLAKRAILRDKKLVCDRKIEALQIRIKKHDCLQEENRLDQETERAIAQVLAERLKEERYDLRELKRQSRSHELLHTSYAELLNANTGIAQVAKLVKDAEAMLADKLGDVENAKAYVVKRANKMEEEANKMKEEAKMARMALAKIDVDT